MVSEHSVNFAAKHCEQSRNFAANNLHEAQANFSREKSAPTEALGKSERAVLIG